MNNKYIQRQEVFDYPSKKIPVVFCIDVSASMDACKGGVPTGKTGYEDGQMWNYVTGGISIMQNLRNCVNAFHDAMLNDRKTSVSCQTAYVTFGDHVSVIEEFGLVKNKKAPTEKLIAKDNSTYIVEALKMSLKMLDDQKAFLKNNSIDYFQPWLIILTDGKAHDDSDSILEIKRELVARQRSNKLIVYTIALADDKEMYQQLRGYSINKPIKYDNCNTELTNFFKYLSKSVSGISNGKISGNIPSYTDPDDIDSLI